MPDEWTDAGFASLLPAGWFARPEDSTALVFCYRVMLVARADLVPPVVMRLDRVCAVFLFGSVTYFDPGRPVMHLGDEGPQISAEPKRAKTRDEGHLLLVTPLRVDGVDGDENEAQQRIQEAAALVQGVLGRNALYDLVFENTFALNGKSVTASTRAMENPWFFPKPEPSTHAGILERCAHVIAGLDSAQRARTGLSLRWLRQAADSSGVDALLRYWIALETLAMPDASDLRPITRALAASYCQTHSATGQRFGIGQIYRLRGLIVHGGQMRPIHGALLKLLDGIYFDVLLQLLGIPSLRRAEAAFTETEMDVNQMLAHSGPLDPHR